MHFYESYYDYTDTTTYLWVYLIVGLIEACIFGAITKAINEKKGYDGGFWWGFGLGVIGIIVVAVRQPYYTVGYIPSGDSIYVAEKTAEKPIDMAAPVPDGGWRCLCGRVHEAYESSCACGQTRRDVLNGTATPATADSRFVPAPVTNPQDWVCTCGKAHLSYETSCICGKTKYEVLTANIVLPDPVSEPEPVSEDDNIEALRKYKALLDDGIITQADYDAKKKQLLGL